MTLKQLLGKCSWEQIEAVIPQYPMLDLRSEEDIIEIKYLKTLYERMRQLQPRESQQKIRLFPEPDTDDWIEAELVFEQNGRRVSRLAEQAFCCLYALLQSEEAKWVMEYLHRQRSRKP